MRIDCEAFDDVAVIRISGDLSCVSFDLLRRDASSLLARSPHDVVINLANVTRIDAVGIGTLAYVHRMAAIAGAAVTLTNLTPRVRLLLDVAGLSTCINISASECEALEGLELYAWK
jgi:anti-anti-sigma factor